MRTDLRRAAAAGVAVTLVMIVGAASPAGAADDDVTFTAALNDEPVEDSSRSDPVALEPDQTVSLDLSVTNDGPDDIVVSRVRLQGSMIGIPMLSYDSAIALDAPAGETTELEVPIIFRDLGRQTTGLLPASIQLYDDEDRQIADQSFTADVRGSSTSALGLLAIVIALLTASSVVALIIAVSKRRLHPNRWRRATRMAFTGLGIGLVSTVTLAAFRLATPTGSVWVPLAIIPTVIGFVLGYLSPGVLAVEEEDKEDEIDRALGAERQRQPVSN